MSTSSPDFQKRIAEISDEDLLAALEFSPKTLEAWAQQWPERGARGLFRDVDDLVITRDLATDSFQPKKGKVLRAAERILRHDIQGWGDVSIQHGSAVDFNADYGQSGKYGFHYWVWAKPLIQAFLLTEDQKYLAEFDGLFNSWYEQRDQVKGAFDFDVIHYELGLGIRNRTFLEYYCLPFAARSLQTHERMLKTLLGAGRWLFDEESRGYRGGNWQVMGCTGLANIASLVPEFRESAAWADVALERLTEHLQKDLYADGCHSERVPSSYMLTVYKDIRNVATLTERRDLDEPLDRMMRWFMQTLPPDNVLPGINDGSRQRMPNRLLKEGMRKFSSEREQSVCLPGSGFTVLRSDGSRNSIYMLINHGPPFGGHTHKDALAFEMHAHGMPMAIDSGIGRTYDDPLHEPWYVTPAAHNMLEVVGAKLDRDATEGRDLVFTQEPDLEYFAATHHGYEQSAGVVHRRHVLFIQRSYFLIVDQIHCALPADFIWHMHSPLRIQQKENSFVAATNPGLTVLRDDLDWTAHHSTAMASVADIPGFDDYAKIDWLQFKRHLPAGSFTFAVLLYPGQDARLTRATDGNWLIDDSGGQTRLCLPT